MKLLVHTAIANVLAESRVDHMASSGEMGNEVYCSRIYGITGYCDYKLWEIVDEYFEWFDDGENPLKLPYWKSEAWDSYRSAA